MAANAGPAHQVHPERIRCHSTRPAKPAAVSRCSPAVLAGSTINRSATGQITGHAKPGTHAHLSRSAVGAHFASPQISGRPVAEHRPAVVVVFGLVRGEIARVGDGPW